ncbi:MAG: zinc-binding alcohol dehydrogenase family protein [Silicimonas sp.]
MQKINALVCAAPGELAVEKRGTPVPGPGDALVRPRRIGICGTDYHIYEGKHPFLRYPRVMGHELAVEIVEAPEGSGFATGEICSVNPYLSCGNCRTCNAGRLNCCENISVLGVHRDGGMAELFTLPAKNLLKADGLSADACAVIEFLAIGAHAVRRALPGAGDSVLVVGAGPIGLGVALFARLTGALVQLRDLDEDRAARVAEIAGVPALDAAKRDYTFVFDATGSRAAMQDSFDHVAPGGTYVMVGVVNDTISFSDPDFHRKEMTLKGSRNATTEDFQRVIEAVRAGEVDVDVIITHRTSLEGAARDLVTWATDKGGLIKAVIQID